MQMYLYYAWHSFVGVIRKLFRTWVAIFLVACIAIGVIFGIIGGILGSALEDDVPVTEEEILPEEDLPGFLPEGPDDKTALAVGELAVGAVVLIVLGLNVFTGEKSGSHIFTMADVNLLFPSPRKPQSVLLFKLGTRLFTYLLLTLYLLFQVPNLLNLGVPVPIIIALFPTWFFLLVFGQLLAVLIYTLTATRPAARKIVRPALYAILGIAAAGFILYTRLNGLGLWEAARLFFNSAVSRFIPVWGWIKAIPFLIYEKNWLWLGLDAAGLILTTALLVRFIWGLDADFYEDALGYAEELDRAAREAAENGKGFARLKKKEHKAETREARLAGEGAAVFFHKSLAIRFRAGLLGFFTKTGGLYLLLAAAGGAGGRFLLQTRSILPVALPLLLAVFIRSFGNPILADVTKSFFLLIPDKTGAKVFWSHLGGTAGTLLDLLPAFLLGWALTGSGVFDAMGWLIFLVTVDFYVASFGVFTDCIVPESVPKQVKAMLQVLLI
ncbi:MAG: hypothetical protein II776_04130 [Clostridia bacterium]|nr:hypothetical protein [Clostridia bacterium]